MEAQNTKRRAWRTVRIPRGIYTDPRLIEASPISLAVLIAMIVWAVPGPNDDGAGHVAGVTQTIGGCGHPDVGWLLDEETGEPFTLRKIALLVRFSEDAVKAAFEELGKANLVALSDKGAWGVIGWRIGIGEDPATQRVRKHRMKGAA